MTQRKRKSDSPGRLITLDAAAEIAASEGFSHLNKKWWTYHSVRGAIPAVPGLVPYVRMDVVVKMIAEQRARNAQPIEPHEDVQGQLQLAS